MLKTEKHGLETTTTILGRINYINTCPMYYPLQKQPLPSGLKIVDGHPSDLNAAMQQGNIDIGPVSSAYYARNSENLIILPDLSISCVKRVMSVILVSRYPLDNLSGKTIALTHASASGAMLLKLFLKQRGITPTFETRHIQRRPDVADVDAALIIGDLALTENWPAHFAFVMDLGELWWQATGLPFVFAVWAVRKMFAEQFPSAVAQVLDLLTAAKAEGLREIDHIAAMCADQLNIDHHTCRVYFDRLKYDMDANQIKGLKQFFRDAYQAGLIEKEARVSFFDPRFAR